MSDYVSDVKQINYSQQTVYEKLSDLTHMQTIKERLGAPGVNDQIRNMAAAEGHADWADKMGDIQSKLENLTFDRDTITVGGTPVGNISLHIIGREEPKTIKFEGLGGPLSANMWVQLLPTGDNSCKLRVTLRAELNFFMRKMLDKKLQSGVENVAAMLAALPYGNI